MAATAIIMAILGCGDAGTACQQVAVAPVRYESVEACVAAQDDILATTDVLYPVLSAECRPVGSAQPASLPKAKTPVPAERRAPIRMASARG